MDEDKQTEEAFGASGSWDKPKLSMEDIPFFSRPSFTSPADKLVGFTESGQPVRESANTGQVYSVALDPDQRTTRTKIEEDVIPAVENWLEDPNLPSMSQVAEAVKQMGAGALESFEKAVEGTGTYGDIFGLAGGTGALGSVGRAPKDSLSMFIGRTANVDLDKLPKSVGKDGKPRWEISDAGSEGVSLEPYNTHFKKTKEDIIKDIESDLNDFGEFQGSTLESVLTHPELYDAYPSLANIPVVVDESLSEFVYGYVPGGNGPQFVAVNKKLLNDPQKFKNTLLHEVQHLVQDKEGFSPGTSMLSLGVAKKSPEVKKELDVEAIKNYEKNLADFKKNQAKRLKDRTPLNTAIKLVDTLQEAKENKLGNDWNLGYNINRLLEAEQKAKSFLESADTSLVKIYGDHIRTPLDELELKIEFAIKDFSDESEEFQNFIKESIGVSPKEIEEYSKKSWSSTEDFPNPLIENRLIRETPLKKPRLPSGSTSSLTVSDETYRRAAGETEARNTGQGRTELTLEQRRQTSPETTEDRPRESQWLVEDYDSFSKGGLAVEEQMNKLYQEGGLADDGTNIEPVTGNEVPTGSMDQEVRDNIPAQLSEGEYVVPADVVRYYGVKFFEDLRGQAKQDFARMEAEGRVGGEPVDTNGMPMEQDEELTPEEMQMLAEALGQSPTGMAMGGMVPQQQQAMYNPYEQQQTQYTPPTPVFQSTRTGMQEGGLAEEAAKGYAGPIFDPSQYSYGGGFSSPFGGNTTTSSGGMEIKEYVNPETGQTRMITVLNGEPIGLVPDGFIPASQEAKQQAQETKQEVETKTEGTRGGDGPPEGFDSPEAPDFSEMSDEQLGQKHANITGPEKTMANMLGAVPGVGLAAKAVNRKMKKDVEEEMAKRNIDIPEKEEVSIMDTISSIFGGGVKGMSADDVEGALGQDPMGDVGFTGDVRGEVGEALGRADEAPGPGPSRGRSGEALGRADEAPGPGPSRGRSSEAPGRADEAPGPGPSRGRSSGPSGPAGASGTAGVGGPSGDSDAGTPRFEGGLMGKPEGSQNKKRKPNQRKKPIKNRKGLASK